MYLSALYSSCIQYTIFYDVVINIIWINIIFIISLFFLYVFKNNEWKELECANNMAEYRFSMKHCLAFGFFKLTLPLIACRTRRNNIFYNFLLLSLKENSRVWMEEKSATWNKWCHINILSNNMFVIISVYVCVRHDNLPHFTAMCIYLFIQMDINWLDKYNVFVRQTINRLVAQFSTVKMVERLW